mmetsp:Transcript_6990/g.25712  ORF Transcript_6990/g.25712 Transcript_6990/m.25712 type:complete len:441 (+) Transcript_6990:680-2002(+)
MRVEGSLLRALLVRRVRVVHLFAADFEHEVRELGVIEVLLQVRLRRRGKRRGFLRGEARDLLGNLIQRRGGVLLIPRLRREAQVAGQRRRVLRGDHLEQNLQAAVIHEDIRERLETPLLLLFIRAAAQMGERDRDARRMLLVRRAHHVNQIPQRAPGHLLLQALQRLRDAVLRRLHDELAVVQPLHRALHDDVRDVIRVLREPVQRERSVVLQVPRVRVEQIEKRSQAVRVADPDLVVLVLCEASERERGHLPELRVRVVQHLNQRLHRAALDDLDLERRLRRRELSYQKRRLALALRALGREQRNHRLQRAFVQDAAFDVRRRVHQVPDDADGFVVNRLVFASDHEDEHRQRAALDDLVFVLVVFERQRPQRARRRALHFRIPRLEQGHQRRDAPLRSDLVLDVVVLVRQVRDRVRGASSDGRRDRPGQLRRVPFQERD